MSAVAERVEAPARLDAAAAPRRPGFSAGLVLGVVGGVSASTKISRLEQVVAEVDVLALVGGVANTFLLASGMSVGKSACEPALIGWARAFLAAARDRGCDIVLPVDVVVAKRFEAGAAHQVEPVASCPQDAIIMDCGPATINALHKLMRSAAAVFWHGPVGAFELPPFNAGTAAVARKLAHLTSERRIASFASGRDTVAAINSIGVSGDFTATSASGWLSSISPPRVATDRV